MLLCSFTPYQSSLRFKESVSEEFYSKNHNVTPVEVSDLIVRLWFVLVLIGLSSLTVGKLNKCDILYKSYPFSPIRVNKHLDIAKTRLTSMRCIFLNYGIVMIYILFTWLKIVLVLTLTQERAFSIFLSL